LERVCGGLEVCAVACRCSGRSPAGPPRIAYDLHREDWRTFRLDRLAEPALTRRRFTPRTLPAPDAASFLRRSITEAPYRYAGLATVTAPAASVLARVPTLLPSKVTPTGDDTCTVVLGADALGQLVQDIVAMDAEFTLDAPDELLDHLDAVAHRLLAATRHARSSPPG
jgi:predicted DNA-binding transcriptional regulator YafY